MNDKRAMPQALEGRPAYRMEWDLSARAVARWTDDLKAADSDLKDASISILDVIGYDPWTGEGITAKRIAGALRSIGADKDIVVNINSPGGDMFEGLAIYNLLREHKGKVTVKVLGLAASAASIVAMAGDEVLVARAGFLMIHDCWAVVVGNRVDLRDFADMIQPFDEAMADIYAARSGLDAAETLKMMDAETWIGGSAAVEKGFADALLPADDIRKDVEARTGRVAAHKLDAVLAKGGLPRAERRALIQELKSGTPSAAGTDTPRAVEGDTPRAIPLGNSLLAEFSAFKTDRE